MLNGFKRSKPKDTIKKLEMVAENRFQAGITLLEQDEDYLAVEQFALAAEMFLKSAYFRYTRHAKGILRITSHLTSANLRSARSDAIRLGVAQPDEGFHSLLFWAALLAAERRSSSHPLGINLENQLLTRVREMHVLWMIENRYQPIVYSYADVLTMRANIVWLRDNHKRIWR